MNVPAKAVSAARERLDSKRSEILAGAKAMFLKHGFGNTSMDAIAAYAGVSKMTVYRHFGSKEALFAGVITDLCQRIVEDDLEDIFKLPPREALRAFASKMIAIVFAPETVELHRTVVAECRRFPELGRLFYETGPAVCIDALARYIANHPSVFRTPPESATFAAEQFLDLLRGYAHLRALLGVRGQSALASEGKIDAAVEYLLNARTAHAGDKPDDEVPRR